MSLKKYIYCAIVLLFSGLIFLLYNNVKIRRLIKDNNNQIGTLQYDEYIEYLHRKYPEVDIIETDESDILSEPSSQQYTLEHCLDIGGKISDTEEYIFHMGGRIEADRFENIYVVDASNDATIRKYNSAGEYIKPIGRRGGGPGEYGYSPFYIISESDTIYIKNGNAISKLNLSGSVLGTLRLTGFRIDPGGFLGAIDDDSNYYLCFYSNVNEKLIHKFDAHGNYMFSFGELMPVKSESLINRQISKKSSTGWICLLGESVIFSQTNPYIIKIYSTEGVFRKVILRKNEFMPNISPKRVMRGDEQGWSWGVPTKSTQIFTLGENIVNCVHAAKLSKNGGRYEKSTIIDIFNKDGVLRQTFLIDMGLWISEGTERGCIYGFTSDFSKPAKVVKFKLING